MDWQNTREVGSRLGIRFTLGLIRIVGYRATRAFVALLALYYTFRVPEARRCLAEFHRYALGRSSHWLTYRSFFAFAESILDRAFAVMGRGRSFNLKVQSPAGLLDGTEPPRGHLVIGAHLGVMEMARAFAETERVNFSMMMHDAPSSRLYDELKRLDPGIERNVIQVASDADSVAPLLEVRARLDRGEYVGILGDRTFANGPRVKVPFMGVEREFPAGPFLLAAALKAPILLMFLVKTDVSKYSLLIERFAEPEDLPNRRDRSAGVEALALRYSVRLEEYARRYPTQWYNFYDFWGPKKD
jgi:predicted LPLAT superfamily acyltransferase